MICMGFFDIFRKKKNEDASGYPPVTGATSDADSTPAQGGTQDASAGQGLDGGSFDAATSTSDGGGGGGGDGGN
jgi:hypothetical protein